jgi:hypothetical protein
LPRRTRFIEAGSVSVIGGAAHNFGVAPMLWLALGSAPDGSPIYAAGSGTIVRHNSHGSFQGDAFANIKLDNGMTVAKLGCESKPASKSERAEQQ